jgi:ribokinase
VPAGGDPLPWERLNEAAAVYFTGGDPEALAAARRARVLVATPRARELGGVRLDALVLSGADPGEGYTPGDLDPPPSLVVSTLGDRGGRWESAEGRTGTWAAAELPGPPVDSYGCGDTFAAALALALGRGDNLDAALAFAGRAAAACLTGRGPFGAPLPAADP